jgi:hypothetical protein
MDSTNLLSDIAYYLNGFFDFLVTVGIVVLALTAVRKADATLGYVLAGAMGVRFVTVCCSRIAYSALPSMGGSDGVMPMVMGGMGLLNALIELSVWCAVGFVLFSLAKKLAPS